MDRIRLPAEFRMCEGCVHFDALFWGRKLKCHKLGIVSEGVVVCKHHKGVRHGRNDGGHSSDNHPGDPGPGVDRRQG